MKHNKNTMTQPSLFVDDHHGRYMGKLAWEYLDEYYKNQARKVLSEDDVKSLENGVDDEWHFEACDNLTNVKFHTRSGQKFYIQYAEGGIWIFPACFLRSKAANEFFGC